MTSFWRATRDVLHGYFGRWWPATAIGVALAIAAPSIVFWSDVELDRPKFVEEWVKLGVGTVALFLLLEIVSHRREQARAASTYRLHIHTCLHEPLLALRADVENVLVGLRSSGSRPDATTVARMRSVWQMFEQRMQGTVVVAPDQPWPTTIVAHNFTRDRNLLESILRASSTAEINNDEVAELQGNLDLLNEAIVVRCVENKERRA